MPENQGGKHDSGNTAIWAKLYSAPEAFLIQLVGESVNRTLPFANFSSGSRDAVVDILLSRTGIAVLAQVGSDMFRGHT